MTGHNDAPRVYAEPTPVDGRWVIVETDELGTVTAEYGYATEAQAQAAYTDLTSSNFITQAQQFLSKRRTAYLRTFLNPPGEEVLRDLAKFCRAHETTFAADARAHAVAEGRREVWLRLQAHLRLTDEELWRLYGQASQPVRSQE